ncbi:MAG TPA: tetratricopeptide repeat protein [Caulobacteraceae bacterium]|nr:tetratricopeptide repeat protein [Caulobacteraceae bacterium]
MRIKALLLFLASLVALGQANTGAAATTFEDGKAAAERGDYSAALAAFRPLAEAGSPAAENALGVLYANGQGLPQDNVEALKWCTLAANQGYAQAQTNLGLAYQYGRGVTQDYSKAADWFLKAANQNNPQAQADLAVMYAMGQGGPRDLVQAYSWVTSAISNLSTADMRDKLGKMRAATASQMTSGQIALGQRIAEARVSHNRAAATTVGTRAPLPAFEFKGATAGISVNPLNIGRCELPDKDDLVQCVPNGETIAGISGNDIDGILAIPTVYITFYRNQLHSVAVFFGGAHFLTIQAAFEMKYGKPCRIEHPNWQNKVGGIFDNTEITWCFASGDLKLSARGAEVDQGRAFYFDRVDTPPSDDVEVDF